MTFEKWRDDVLVREAVRDIVLPELGAPVVGPIRVSDMVRWAEPTSGITLDRLIQERDARDRAVRCAERACEETAAWRIAAEDAQRQRNWLLFGVVAGAVLAIVHLLGWL